MFKPHQNLWKVSVSMLFLCRLQKAVVMETVCLADEGFVFTGSDTAELKTGSNVNAVHRFRALKEPKVLMRMVMMTVIMTMTTMTCYPP